MPPARAALVAKTFLKKDDESKRTPEHHERSAKLQEIARAAEGFDTEREKREWLDRHDHNKNGLFERSEFIQIIMEVAELEEVPGWKDGTLKQVLSDDSLVCNQIDKHYKGKETLGPDEVHAAVRQTIELAKKRVKLVELFNSCDNNGDGVLDEAELCKFLQTAAPADYQVTAGDCKFIIDRCDADGDGRISVGELAPAVATWMEYVTSMEAKQDAEKPPTQKKSSACALL
jgi:Ca2+-binding EF-hand superfamily protein